MQHEQFFDKYLESITQSPLRPPEEFTPSHQQTTMRVIAIEKSTQVAQDKTHHDP